MIDLLSIKEFLIFIIIKDNFLIILILIVVNFIEISINIILDVLLFIILIL